jgi:hypothetical protein
MFPSSDCIYLQFAKLSSFISIKRETFCSEGGLQFNEWKSEFWTVHKCNQSQMCDISLKSSLWMTSEVPNPLRRLAALEMT